VRSTHVFFEVLAKNLGGQSLDGAASGRDRSNDVFAPSFFDERAFHGFDLTFHAPDACNQFVLVADGVHRRKIPPRVSGIQRRFRGIPLRRSEGRMPYAREPDGGTTARPSSRDGSARAVSTSICMLQ